MSSSPAVTVCHTSTCLIVVGVSSVSTGAPRRPAVANSAAFRSVPGWRPVPTVLFAVALTAVGVLIDRFGAGALGWGTRIGFTAGVLAGVVMVRRRSLYTAAVQPPMVFAGVVLTVLALTTTGRFTVTLIGVTTEFPTMAAGTALVGVVALIRKFGQPLYRARTAPE